VFPLPRHTLVRHNHLQICELGLLVDVHHPVFHLVLKKVTQVHHEVCARTDCVAIEVFLLLFTLFNDFWDFEVVSFVLVHKSRLVFGLVVLFEGGHESALTLLVHFGARSYSVNGKKH